ncbi:MAG TPA: prolyl oligopeptidase family serine peptidase [Verrucomicrobiales bacterium]|jgi:predicted peptidase|nr:prolyl oligopeptidase family serine peptidase [Verrucomicrobiales bacterium]
MLGFRMFKALFPVLLGIFTCFSPASGNADQSARTFVEEKTLKLDYLLSLPDGYEAASDKKWPLVVFLHGSGERGKDLQKITLHGLPRRVKEGATFPFILASPQCPDGEWWTEQPVLELIDSLEAAYRVDTSRLYLTGMSMGGYGTWHFATLAPKRFAAIAPVCGGGVPYKMQSISRLPVWAFHGAKDTVVQLDESERLVKALQKSGNKDARLTVYPEAAHDSWTETYQNPELYNWLLSHNLSAKN